MIEDEEVALVRGLAFGRVRVAALVVCSTDRSASSGLLRFAEVSAVGTAFRFPSLFPQLVSAISLGFGVANAPSSTSPTSVSIDAGVLFEDIPAIPVGVCSAGVADITGAVGDIISATPADAAVAVIEEDDTVDGASVTWGACMFDAVGRITGEGVGAEVTLVAGEIAFPDCFED